MSFPQKMNQNSFKDLEKTKVVIITGTGAPARVAANIYCKNLRELGVKTHIVENSQSIYEFIKIFKRLWKRYGLLHAISVVLSRVLIKSGQHITKQYEVDERLANLEKLNVERLCITSSTYIITNACALLSADLINKIYSKGGKLVNVHNGLNPRYRGTGNFWAAYERNFDCMGVTIHYLDEGIDTGRIIALKKIDFIKEQIAFDEIDKYAFAVGARMVIDYLKHPHLMDTVSRATYLSKAYSFPTMSQYALSKKRYNAKLESNVNGKKESNWKKSFENIVNRQELDTFQKQHWGDSTSVITRDEFVKSVVGKINASFNVLDLGCGDGRYRDFWRPAQYFGVDFSIETMKLGGHIYPAEMGFRKKHLLPGKRVFCDKAGNVFIETSVNEIPLNDTSINLVLAIGLFQHLDNTGSAAEEILRVMSSNSLLVLNTLRQPSIIELVLGFVGKFFDRDMIKLLNISLRQDYFRNKIVAGTEVARRYTRSELRNLFEPYAKIQKTYFHGIFGTRIFSREITIVFKRR